MDPVARTSDTDHFDSTELVHLLAQAKVYRLAALLVAHRLRHDFGSEDDKAGVWSKEVMRELELTKHMTKQPLRFVTLPFIVAAIEVRGTEARVSTLQAVKDYVDGFAPVIQRATTTFLSRIWHERDITTTARWFDSISKPCVVLHSTDTALCA